MDPSHSLPELVAAAQATAKTSQKRISDVLSLMDGQNGSAAQLEDLREATVALERAAVDIFSLFEARMQHHFKRGPFSRKLKALLLETGHSDLANRIHQYYLAINVLKHGTGASYRELQNDPNSLIVIKPAIDIIADETHPPAGLVDVTTVGFFDGLSATILEATDFLESK